MKKETLAGEYNSRRKALGTVGKFILPTIVTVSLGDLAVGASSTNNIRTVSKKKNDNPGWGDHDGGGKDKTGSKR